ncbi:putative cytochrome p450 [Lyophyllum shimeji]|uniref:Cytochrome p450 n=1 Tax=Lyophyllum shimeji TaxID=47721 RepID=A0A9P3PL22_LYOSH|nr:putative cytochrome p450 [Lyophyllum shimeji]
MSFTLPVLSACCLLLLCVHVFFRPRRPPLPPSPPAKPFIGHLRIAPSSDFETFFYKLGKAYGPVTHLNVLGRITVVINNLKAAVDLLDKRSANYSDRAPISVVECMGWKNSLGFMPYGEPFQRHRRMFHQYFNKEISTTYQPIQLREARLLAQNLAVDPSEREKYFKRFSTAIVMRITHGHEITADDDPFVNLVDEVGAALTQAGRPGATVLDFFPFLKYMPAWFPGTFYARFARENVQKVRDAYDYPFNQVKEQMAQGTARPSIVATQLEGFNNQAADHKVSYDLDDIKGMAVTCYVAGTESTSSALSIFLLAMVLYPQCQLKAQEELDAVIGRGRLPEFSDRASLPYLESLLHETLRWNHPVPTAVPHRVLEDDVYEGMFIPKGSVVVPNIRGMTWDEDVYADPFSFDPTRFSPKPIGRGEPLPGGTWGFGRRICPGRYFADASLWIAMATMLHTLHMSKDVDNDGKEITPQVTFTTSLASRPSPFPCRIRPRSAAMLSLLQQADTSDNY